MKGFDFLAISLGLALGAFFGVPAGRDLYAMVYEWNPVLVSFVKFALLATGGEMLAARIRGGRYLPKGFGLLPKMIVWGVLGVSIYYAFRIFSVGAATLVPAGDGLGLSILRAAVISVTMNLFFAPAMMVTHHVTDLHIAHGAGRFRFARFRLSELLASADWERMGSFVLAKTIPFFWIPAHTITFLLPAEFRTLFAAFLSVVLGVLLAVRTTGSTSR